MSTLKWSMLAKNGVGMERKGQEGVRLLFRLRTGSASLLEENKICKMIIDERCVLVAWGI